MARTFRDRCFVIPDGEGSTIRIHADKEPKGKTLTALQALFRVAREQMKLKYPEPGHIDPKADR